MDINCEKYPLNQCLQFGSPNKYFCTKCKSQVCGMKTYVKAKINQMNKLGEHERSNRFFARKLRWLHLNSFPWTTEISRYLGEIKNIKLQILFFYSFTKFFLRKSIKIWTLIINYSFVFMIFRLSRLKNLIWNNDLWRKIHKPKRS